MYIGGYRINLDALLARVIRAQVVAAALAAIWKQSGLSSSVLALDTETGDGSGQVAVIIDAAAADDPALAELPQRLAARTPSWHADWRGTALVVDVPTPMVSAPGGPLLIPLLTHGRGGRTTRYIPLTWGDSQPTPTRHLGLYGAQALGVLHAALGSLLYAQPPTALALAILDKGKIAPLYRTAPHRVDLPEGGAAAVDALVSALRRIPRRADVRPLLLVVVEPDASVLLALDALLPRLRQQPDAPLHLLIVQERLRRKPLPTFEAARAAFASSAGGVVMSPRSAPSRRTAARPSTPRPKGMRLPHPGALTRFVQWLALACVLLALIGLYARPWAEQRLAEQAATTREQRLDSHARVSSDAAPRLPLPTLPPFEIAAPQLVRWLYAPPRSTLLWLIAALDIALIAAEVGLNTWVLFSQQRRMRHRPTTYLRVRAPAPPISMSGRALGAGGTPSGDQFFRAIQKEGIPFHFWRRFTGTAPWVAFTFTGVPDEPIELGIVVASRSDRQREDMAMAIRTVIQGQAPGAQVEQHPDPLAAALEMSERPSVVGWCDYGLALPPHYPLRFLEDIEGSDLLGPLAAALVPHGTLRAEAQIMVRPARMWALTAGWRGRATALLLTLQAKEDYALAADARSVEAKLDATPYEAWLRIVVVAEGDDARARVRTGLNQIQTVLGQYAERTSNHLQHFVRLGARLLPVPPMTPPKACASVIARAPRPTPLFSLALPFRLWRDPMMLTSIEIASLWHLPTPALAHLVRWLPCRVLPAEPHTYTQGRPDRIVVGHARRADGSIAPVGPTLRDLRQILHLTAGMGTGKSRLLANVCAQLMPQGFLLLDGKGDDRQGNLAATVRQHIPLEAEGRTVILDILDTEWPFGLNPMAQIDLAQPGGVDQGLAQLLAVFARLDPETWGKSQGMQQYAKMGALLVLETVPLPTLAHVKQVLVDDGYRASWTRCRSAGSRSRRRGKSERRIRRGRRGRVVGASAAHPP